jgi:hypothetical protein
VAGIRLNRHPRAAAAFLLALNCLATSSVRAQVAAPASRSIEAAWQAERVFHLNRAMERARATMAGSANAESNRTLAGLEALVASDAKRTARPAKTVKEIATLRTMLYKALNNLEAAEARFDDRMLTAWERDWAYRAVVKLLLN